jgi:D-2-hydroxyacid dehydrogenase (NADP+)
LIVVLWVHSNVFANFRLSEAHLHRLQQSFPGATFLRCETQEQFLEALPRADVVCSFRFKAEWFSRAPRLRRLISPTAGRDWFPEELSPGVKFEFSTFHGRIMAETVVAMMLSHARGLLRAYSLQRDEAWPNQTLEPGLRLLKGSRVTVLGFGHIGSHSGRLVKCFGAVVTGLRRNPGARTEYFAADDQLLPAEYLDEVLSQTDHLVLCLPGNYGNSECAAPSPASGECRHRSRLELTPPRSWRDHRTGASHPQRGEAGICKRGASD